MGIKKFGHGDEMKEWSRRIQDIMDEMRNRNFCDYRASGTWMPNVNIYKTRSEYYVCLELAQVDLDSISIDCPDAQHIRVMGNRPRPPAPDLDDVFSVELMEVDEGLFCREIDFADAIDTEDIEMAYHEGFLWIILHKAPAT